MERGSGGLTRRERQVASLVAQGLTNREIGEKLFISERTAEYHVEQIRNKLGFRSRSQIATWFAKSASEEPPGPRPTAQPRPRRKRIVGRPRWLATVLLLAVVASGGLALLVHPWNASSPTIFTVAGAPAGQSYPGGGKSGDGGLALNAQLARPTDVAVDASGSIYIADYGNQKVRLVDGQKKMATYAGGGSKALAANAIATSVELGYASSVAVDGRNRLDILTAVEGSLQLWRVEPGKFMTPVKTLGPAADFELQYGPYLPVGGLAVAPDGTLYIADRAGNRVLRLAPDGTLSPYAGDGHPGFGGDGAAAISAQLRWPIGLALDHQGNLYIADAANNRIRKVDRRGRITTVAGSGAEGNSGDGGPAADAQLSFPFGVAVGPDGRVVVADTGNHRLRQFTPGGAIQALAGTGCWGFTNDPGPALQTVLNGPEAVTFDSKGDLFIADTENQRVREIARLSPPGKVFSGVAGTAVTSCQPSGASTPNKPAADIIIASDLATSANAQDVVALQHAIDFAIRQQGRVAGFTLGYWPLDDSLGPLENPVRGVENVDRMIEVSQVLGMIGPFNSSVAFDEIPAANAADLVMLSPSNTNRCLTQQFCDQSLIASRPSGINNYFRIAAPEPLQGRAMARFAARSLKLTRVAAFNMWGAVGDEIIKEFSAELKRDGGDLVLEQDLDAQTTDFSAFLAEAARRGAQAIYAVGDGGTPGESSDVCLARAQMDNFLPDAYFLGTDGVTGDPKCITDAVTAERMFSTYMDVDATHSSDPAVKQIVSKFTKAYPTPGVSIFTFAAYDSARMLIAAIGQAIKANHGSIPTRPQVRDALANIQGFQGVTGTYSFDPNGDAISPLMSIWQIDSGRQCPHGQASCWVYGQKIDVSF